jgi:hypothetical protein
MANLTPAERLRRASHLWHSFLQVTGERFELAQFVSDASVERRTLEAALASGNQGLIGLAQEWLRDTGQAQLAVPVAASAPVKAPAANAVAEPAKPSRYLRGVR